jgi:hypothetical protein
MIPIRHEDRRVREATFDDEPRRRLAGLIGADVLKVRLRGASEHAKLDVNRHLQVGGVDEFHGRAPSRSITTAGYIALGIF